MWVNGVYVKAGLEREKAAILVVMAALSDGSKVMVSAVPGYRESTRSWSEVLRDLRDRGLNCPRLVVGDGHLGINVSRISAIVESIAETLGQPLELAGEVRHTFPTPDMVLEAGVETLAELGLGMDRHSKIIAAAERIHAGRLDLAYLSQPEVCYAEAKRRLMGCYGIGDKVADCISLFSLDKMEAFPVDRWVARAMTSYFPRREQGHVPSSGVRVRHPVDVV